MVMLVALIFNLFFFLTTAASSSWPQHSVIVIGAGMSGIMAAKTLHDTGCKDFLILEASSRIGGRIYRGNIGGHTVELGANWLFSGGPNTSPSLQIAKGGLYEKHEVESVIQIADKRDDFATSLSKNLSSAKAREDDDVSILESQCLLKQVPSTPLEMAIDYLYNDYIDAEPPRITSLKTAFPRHGYFGEDSYFVSDGRGFESVVHHIAKGFLSFKNKRIKDPRLKLNKLWKILAINNFDMAVYTKIFLKFPCRFWPAGPGTEFFIYVHERRGYFPVWKHLENEIPGSNILFVTITDEESRRIEQQSDEKTKAEVMNVLRKLFGNKIPEPETILVPRWWSNRFYKGSYSNWPNGYTHHTYNNLKKPVGPIYFTGEHTNSSHLGYADGAYFAGINTANDLIKCSKQSGEGPSYIEHVGRARI